MQIVNKARYNVRGYSSEQKPHSPLDGIHHAYAHTLTRTRTLAHTRAIQDSKLRDPCTTGIRGTTTTTAPHCLYLCYWVTVYYFNGDFGLYVTTGEFIILFLEVMIISERNARDNISVRPLQFRLPKDRRVIAISLYLNGPLQIFLAQLQFSVTYFLLDLLQNFTCQIQGGPVTQLG